MTADGRLTGQVALVTGGGGGIGQATARLLCEEGASVAVVDSDRGAAERVAAGIGSGIATGTGSGTSSGVAERVLAIGASLDEEAEAERAIAETVERFGRLDILANVAGVRVYGPLTEADPDSWDTILRGNLLQVGYMIKFAVPAMTRSGGGTIVNVSSANAVTGRSGMAQYDATKAGVLALTRSVAHDHAADGIRCNAVCPGPTLTEFHVRRRTQATGESPDSALAALAAGTPTLLERQADPREIAYPILFLASAESSYVTGTTLMVDGGLSA